MTKKQPFSEQLRRAIRESELTRYRIWQETGISQSVLCRFVNNAGVGLSLDAVDKLVDCLGLRLVAEGDTWSRRSRKKGGA